MGLLDELKRLTKPYDTDDYLEEDLQEPVSAAPRARTYTPYSEPQQPQQPAARNPYISNRQPAAAQQPQYQQESPQQDPYGYSGQNQQTYGQPQQQYDRQPAYQTGPAYNQNPYSQQMTYSPAQPSRLLLVKPDRFDQAAEIADKVRNHFSVVISLEEAPAELTRRLVDFLSGAAYALNGNIQKVSSGIYLITPVDVDPTIESLDALGSKTGIF